MELNEEIARAATSWNRAFPMRKEVNREVAVVCRTAMSLARKNGAEPKDCIEEAIRIRGTIDVDEVVDALEQLA
ncbi:MAG: hypothetical protein M0R06_00850 [Sphaerochaeta sp.]|jgi:hypothetical protein|nr:hypothetical protein [Sphaerochaeta sp.]